MTADGSGSPTAPLWWRSGTVYQIYPRSFADSNGDGVGDLRGAIEHLDHLERLGVDAVWLSPIFASPHRDNGYDISDYQAVDPQFGTMGDLAELVSGLHSRGMRLVLDLVLNHTSTEHPWFRESALSRDSPKRDWYIWRPARPGTTPGRLGSEPTNWESYFSEPAWQHDPTTDEYYLHLFAVEQADLNWENPEVRAAVYGLMNWWLDRGVDGFRMDVINLISKRCPFADGPVPDAAAHRLGDGSAYYLSGPRLHEFLAEMDREVFAGRDPGLVRIGETPGVTLDEALLLTDPARNELDMVFQFEHVDLDRDPRDWKAPAPLELTDLKRSLATWQDAMAGVGWNSLYWGNHDQPRAVSRFGDDSVEHWEASAKTLATVLYLMQGTAFVYQGDEIGMRSLTLTNVEALADVASLNYYSARVREGISPEVVMQRLQRTARDHARTPMHWDDSATAGFSDGRPWYPVSSDHAWLNAAAQESQPGSVLSHYRSVIRLRKKLRVLRDGAFRLLDPDDPQTFCYERTGAGGLLRVVANFSSQPLPFSRLPAPPPWAGSASLLDTHPDHPLVGPSGGTMPPWRSFVWFQPQ